MQLFIIINPKSAHGNNGCVNYIFQPYLVILALDNNQLIRMQLIHGGACLSHQPKTR